MTEIKYSFVIPVYKSVESLEPLFMGIKTMCNGLKLTFEVIFVEDNGSEESWKKLLELKKIHPDTITLIKLTKNFGQNGATLCGIGEANGEFIVTMDDDLQVQPSEIEKLIACERETKADVIYGVYKEESQHFLRNAGSNLVKKVFNITENGANIGSSIRLINTGMAKYLKNHLQDHLFINQVLSWYTFDTRFVEVTRNPRNHGKSGYSFWQLFKIAFRLLFLYTSIPLKIMIAICILSSIASLALAGYYIYQHFTFGTGLGFLSLVVIAISLILASISIIGIYINRLYSSRVKKPHYAIKLKL